METIIVLVVLAGLVFWGVAIYNKLVTLKNRFENAFSQIEVQLKRRYDLIPNLVETAKGYLGHERETLEAVIAARNQAMAGLQAAAQDPSNADAIKHTLQEGNAADGPQFFMENDPRVLRCGHVLRRYHLDELPQLYNVLLGQMSFVGPRPDVPGYADKLKGEDWVVLSVRPGITGPASLKYKGEEELLSRHEDPVKYNDEVIWPDKVRINREYVNQFSFSKEFYYIWKTIVD